jgi:hypothetical protein
MQTASAPMSASSAEPRSWAFVASLAGGLVVASAGVIMSFMMLVLDGMPGMMTRMEMRMPAMFLLVPVWAFIMGGVMILGAVRIRASPKDTTAWGVAIIIASTFSLLASGGFMIGALLGLVGGGIALSVARHA